MKLGGREWPSPGAHDDECGHTIGIRKREAKSCRPAPIVTDKSCPAKVEPTQQSSQVRDMRVETVRFFASRFFREAEPDHIRDDNPISAALNGAIKSR